jgi:hypothetical protein
MNEPASDAPQPPAAPPLPAASAPIELYPLESPLPLEDEYAAGEGLLDPGVRVPKSIVWGILILLGVVLLVAVIWGFTQSTITYGVPTVDAATTAQLSRIRATLVAADAPPAALQHLDVAAQPGVNVGDAIEALVITIQELTPITDNPPLVEARKELHLIWNDLDERRYGGD